MTDLSNKATDKLDNEISEIGAIHHETVLLFNKFKTLPEAMLEKHLHMLIKHLEAHFEEEKRLMTLHNYAEIQSHCAEHKLMEEKLESFTTKLNNNTNLHKLRLSLAEGYLNQLIKHIELSDTKMLEAIAKPK